MIHKWVRRSHRHWAWADGIGDGADAFPELYRLTVTGPDGQIVIETAGRSVVLGQSQIPAQAGQPITVSVEAIGPAALSHPATSSLIL